MAKEELVIVPGKKESVFNENGYFTKYVDGRAEWQVGTPIKGGPEYVAIYVANTNSVQVIAEVNTKKSKLKDGIVAMENPIKVSIPVRFGKNKLQGITYSTFRKLITHKTTDDL